jgi:hypothetical protein
MFKNSGFHSTSHLKILKSLNTSQKASFSASVQAISSAIDHLSMAKQYLSEAFKLLERSDPFDAAEKIWVAVRHATTALAMRILGEVTPPKGVSMEIIC